MALHKISNERALVQWRALTRQPLKFAQRFHKRFLDEQPHLAQLMADCIVAERQPGVEHAKLSIGQPAIEEQVVEVMDYAACLSETIWREAGHPLRQLSQEEVERHFQPILAQMQKLPKLTKFGGLDDMLPLVTTCRQEDLLRGVCIAYFSSAQRRFLDLLLITALLRLGVDALEAAVSAQTGTLWDLDRVEEALSVQGDPMRRGALIAAKTLRADLAPRLVAELESWIADPQSALEEDGSLGMHALFLLACWRETSAWPVLRRLFSSPDQAAHDLCGDLITERGGVFLASVVGERDAELREMCEDDAGEEFCRAAALEALACRVAWGERPCEELIRYLRELLSGRLKVEPGNYVWTSVISLACDLEAWELLPEIETTFARDVVDETVVDSNYVAAARDGKFGSLWTDFIQQHAPIRDVAEATAWLDDPIEVSESSVELPSALPPDSDSARADLGASRSNSDAHHSKVRAPPKVGRNDPCPCGSGKKYKKCCGR